MRGLGRGTHQPECHLKMRSARFDGSRVERTRPLLACPARIISAGRFHDRTRFGAVRPLLTQGRAIWADMVNKGLTLRPFGSGRARFVVRTVEARLRRVDLL